MILIVKDSNEGSRLIRCKKVIVTSRLGKIHRDLWTRSKNNMQLLIEEKDIKAVKIKSPATPKTYDDNIRHQCKQ